MIVRSARSIRHVWGVAGLMLALTGCVPAVPVTTGSAPAPATPPPATQAPPVTPPAPPRRAPATVVADSTPSEDAERVLETIPEPLGGAPQPSPRRAVQAPEAAYDTLRVSRDSDDGVPVPAPIEPMRAAPVTLSPADTAGSRPAAPAIATPPSATMTPNRSSAPPQQYRPPAQQSPPPTQQPPPPSFARPEPPAPKPAAPPADGVCWRLQVAAPAEREKAISRLEAAESLLLVLFVIEREQGLHKVRTRDCMSKEAADVLRRRAQLSGFEGSFATRGAPLR